MWAGIKLRKQGQQHSSHIDIRCTPNNDVKFRQGIPGRFSGMAGNDADCVSVLLNPTLVDSRPPGLVAMSPEAMSSAYLDQITLQLHYKDGAGTSGVLPLGDYLVVG